ncbi:MULTISPECIES: hypothetical protein [Solibacillus]|uniref:Uncharacterized protein n=1 Tax=Solibacillus faecavium TaxID=2762221 RepID=A0ABR8Y389_9BACL|nr:hypothetical protein [Solibacillus faecavium]MBD8038573.1 hypothetical protein [Solibacillus faecavium]
MAVVTMLIGLYAFLTGIAGIKQCRTEGFQVRSFMFVLVSIGIIVSLFIPNKEWQFLLLLVAFILLHLLAIAQGIATNGRINYRHHIIRFIFHCIIILMV